MAQSPHYGKINGMYLIIVALVVFLPCVSVAIPLTAMKSTSSCSPIHKTDFIPGEAGLKQLGLNLELGAAAPRIVVHTSFPGDRTITCTGTITSTKGYMLTAGHCVERCLEALGVYRTETQIDQAKLNAATCEVDVDGKKLRAKILATSLCKLWKSYEHFNECSSVDYALLKFEAPPSELFGRCLSSKTTSIKPFMSLGSFGHPDVTHRHFESEDGDIKTSGPLYYSVGKSIPFTDKCVHSSSGEETDIQDISTPEVIAQFKSRVQSGALVQTTVDNNDGSSGGPVLDTEDLSTVGIATMAGASRVQSEFEQCAGATFTTPLSAIAQEIKANFPSVDLSETLKCETSQ